MPLDDQGRREPPLAADPVEQVWGFCTFLRETLLWKCEGLSEEQLRWSPVPSGVSLLGMLRHCLNVERWWIAKNIGALDVGFDWNDHDPDGEWRTGPEVSLASVRAAFAAEAELSDQVLTGLKWDDIPKDAKCAASGRTVGWVVTHMVEEFGRHCGHADFIRELIDGQTGE
jgi:uncharacterized damage-inducible protein DinB